MSNNTMVQTAVNVQAASFFALRCGILPLSTDFSLMSSRRPPHGERRA